MLPLDQSRMAYSQPGRERGVVVIGDGGTEPSLLYCCPAVEPDWCVPCHRLESPSRFSVLTAHVYNVKEWLTDLPTDIGWFSEESIDHLTRAACLVRYLGYPSQVGRSRFTTFEYF